MQPVRSIKNQFRGINPHLHSRFQAEGGWVGFHTRHIGDLAGLLRRQLFSMGYTAEIEQAVQVRRPDAPTRYPRADVLIVDQSHASTSTPTAATAVHEQATTIPEALAIPEEDIDHYKAVAIYKLENQPGGKPVAWIELLSPSNKPGGSDWDEYRNKRENLLRGGMVFIELDYLHESPPTLATIQPYPHDTAYPYHIVVLIPRPTFAEGPVHTYHFAVDTPLPAVNIPLLEADVLTFDFGPAYQKTYAEMLYGNEVDYSRLPHHFDRYNQSDRTRIASKMVQVVALQQTNHNLETASIPDDILALDDAIAQIESWQTQET